MSEREGESVAREKAWMPAHMCTSRARRSYFLFFYCRNIPTCIEYARYLSVNVPFSFARHRFIPIARAGKMDERVTNPNDDAFLSVGMNAA